MQRRTVLKSAAGIGAVGIGGAALTGSGAADTHADTDYSVGDITLSSDTGDIDYVAMYGEGTFEWRGLETPATHVEIETTATAYDSDGAVLTYENDAGETESLEDVHLNTTGPIALSQGADWGNHDDELSGEGTRGYVTHGVGIGPGGNYDKSIEWVIVGEKPADVAGSGYGLPDESLSAKPFTAGDDGESATYDVVVTSTYTLYNGTGEDQEELVSTSTAGNISITVENIAAESGTTEGDEGGATGGASNDGELAGEAL